MKDHHTWFFRCASRPLVSIEARRQQLQQDHNLFKGAHMNHPHEINGVNVAKMLEFKGHVMKDSAKGDHNPSLVAHWVGGTRSRIELKDKVAHIGGHGEFNSMQMLLATLAACDVDLIAIHASFLGLRIES